MKKTFIHIGLPKTATTFLQQVVFPNFKNTKFIHTYYFRINDDFSKLKNTDDTLYNKQKVLDEIDKINYENVIISDETFCGITPSLSNRSMIANRLKEVLPDAHIIIFLRSQGDLLLSNYNQLTKMGGVNHIQQVYDNPTKSINFTFDMYENGKNNFNDRYVYFKEYQRYFNPYNKTIHLDNFLYFELITLYKKLFKNVSVFLYEEFVSNPLAVINKIEKLVGDSLVNKDLIFKKKHVNTSFSSRDLKSQRFLNKINLLTSNKLVQKVLFFLYYHLNRNINNNTEKNYISEITDKQNYYQDNNLKIIETYPEINIQNYPDKYIF